MLHMSIAYRDVVDAATSEKLAGGLPTTIVLRAYLFRDSGGEPIAASYKTCRVIFDLWDEVYRVEIHSSAPPISQPRRPRSKGFCAVVPKWTDCSSGGGRPSRGVAPFTWQPRSR